MLSGDEVLSLYESVSGLTGQMLAAARHNNWEDVAALEATCSAKVDALKQGEAATLLSDEMRDRKAALIRQTLEHDEAIRALAAAWMSQLTGLIGNAGVQRKLEMSYGSNQQL